MHLRLPVCAGHRLHTPSLSDLLSKHAHDILACALKQLAFRALPMEGEPWRTWWGGKE